MDRRGFIASLAGLALCPLCQPNAFAEDAHWGYEGEHGPAKWGDMDAANKVCAVGAQQSPLDIGQTVRAQLPPLVFDWAKHADSIINNGHTIQVNFAEGSTLTVGTEKYNLLQVHFHHPSEHLIGGKKFPMEAHFVHRNAAGNLAVVGVLMEAGKPNPAFGKIISLMPEREGPAVKIDVPIDPNGMLPANRGYFFYAGSLTTPPCSEIVNWLLLTHPISVAEANIAAFAKLYPMNARPVQQPNRRTVMRSG